MAAIVCFHDQTIVGIKSKQFVEVIFWSCLLFLLMWFFADHFCVSALLNATVCLLKTEWWKVLSVIVTRL